MGIHRHPDRVTKTDLAEVLERQRGVVTREQALQTGLTPNALRFRLTSGSWQYLYRAVYATTNGELPRAAQLWAAVLWTGEGAALSHMTAAELWGLVDSPRVPLHVIVPARRRLNPPRNVILHRSRRIDLCAHPALLPPRTRLEDTVLDLVEMARCLDDALSWVARACGRRLTTPRRLMRTLEARSRMRWRTELLAGLDDVGLGAQSLLELRYLRNVERPHGLPKARRQRRADRYGRRQWDDLSYEEYDTTVELDGRLGHDGEGRWRDMRRDNAVVAEGRAPLRYGYADVTEHPCEVAAQVARILQSNGWTGTPRA